MQSLISTVAYLTFPSELLTAPTTIKISSAGIVFAASGDEEPVLHSIADGSPESVGLGGVDALDIGGREKQTAVL